MKRLIEPLSYLFVAALGGIIAMAAWGHPYLVVKGTSVTPCVQVIISEFGDPRFYRDKVCSDEDLARIYGEQQLREQEWVKDHECDSQDADEPDVKRMKVRR